MNAFVEALFTSPSITKSIADAFLVAAIPEEVFKFIALYILVRKNPYFDEHIDGIVYAVFVGLGFAALENVFYLFDDEDWVSTAVGRSLLSVPGHYAFAVLMGYYYSLYHFVEHSLKNAVCVLFAPILAHGIYDSLAMSGDVDPYLGMLCFVLLIAFCIRIHKIARNRIKRLIHNDIQS